MIEKIGKRGLLIIIGLVIIILAVLYFMLGKKETKWVQNGNTITKGNQTLSVGDSYDYDETNSGKIEGLNDVNWKVLGVDDEGNLLIMSTSDVMDVTLGEKDNLEVCKNDYINGTTKLNDLASSYGKGEGAIGARSVTIDDINKITKYNPEEYATSEIGEYNNEVTYYWTDDEKPMYESTNGVVGNLSNNHDVFVWYDEVSKVWKSSEKLKATKENPVKITTVKTSFYTYPNTGYYSGISLLDKESKEYKLLFTDEKEDIVTYWVSTPFVNTANQFVGYGYRQVKGEDVNYTYLVYSPGHARSSTAGLRVVVTIN